MRKFAFFLIIACLFGAAEIAAQEKTDSLAAKTDSTFLKADSVSQKLNSEWYIQSEKAFDILRGILDSNGNYTPRDDRGYYRNSPKQNESKLSVQIQSLVLWSYGLNGNVIDELRYYESLDRPSYHKLILNYMFEKKPLGLADKSQFGALSGAVNYRLSEKYLLSLEILTYNVKKSLSGRVEVPWDDNLYAGGVAVPAWGDPNLWGLWNEKWKSGYGPIDYKAWDYFKNFQVEAGVTQKTGLTGLFGFDLYGGVRYAQPETELNVLVNNYAYYLTSNFWLVENTVTLRSILKTEYSLIGPVAGLKKDWQWGLFRFNISFKESFLMGEAGYTSKFYDTDDIWLTSPYLIDGKPEKYNIVYYGQVPFYRKEKIFVPVTDMKAEIGFARIDPGDENKSIIFSIGVMGQYWHGLPVGPYIDRPWDIGNPVNAPSGMGQKVKETKIAVNGAYASVRINF